MAKTFCKKCGATIEYSVTDLSRTVTKQLAKHDVVCSAVYGERYTEAEVLEASEIYEQAFDVARKDGLAILIDWKRTIESARFADKVAAGPIENASAYQAKQELESLRANHNARRLAWRDYVCVAYASDSLASDAGKIADELLAEEEERFGEVH